MSFCLGPPDSGPDPIYLQIGKLQDEMLKFDFLMLIFSTKLMKLCVELEAYN